MENFCYSRQMSLDQVAMLVCNTMLALSYMIISDDISDHRDEQHEEIRHQFFYCHGNSLSPPMDLSL